MGFECAASLVFLVVLVLLTSCATVPEPVIIYKEVSVPVQVLPEVPEWWYDEYSGPVPVAADNINGLCFGDDDANALVDWVVFHKSRYDNLRSMFKNR